jgi:hypothetical protein
VVRFGEGAQVLVFGLQQGALGIEHVEEGELAELKPLLAAS